MQINGKVLEQFGLKIILKRLLIKLNYHKFIIKDLKTVKDSINAIKTMEVRGAQRELQPFMVWFYQLLKKMTYHFLKSSEDLVKSRPTAINLKWAVDRMMKKLMGVNSNEILKKVINEPQIFAKRI